MVLASVKTDNEKFIPVLNECFLNLKIIAQSMTNESVRKNTLHEFLYKLKCLEKELYLISIKLRETCKKNETLMKDLEAEKERSRKRAARIHELESQLANAEFKLKLRYGTKERPKCKRDASFQYGYRIDSKTDIFHTMQNLRTAAHDTINSIRQLIAPGGGDFKIPILRDFDSRDMETESLRQENAYLQKLIAEKEQILQSLSSLKFTHVTHTPKPGYTSGSSTTITPTCKTDQEDTKSDWNDPTYPYKVINKMEKKIKKLKQGGVSKAKMSKDVTSKMCNKNLAIQQKIEEFFDRD